MLKARLQDRGTETEKSLQIRLDAATQEIELGLEQDSEHPLMGYRMLNDKLDQSIPLFIRIFEALYGHELESR